jgi:hypothetical protein
LWVGGDGVKKAWIAAEGAEDAGGGFVAVEEVHWGPVVRLVLDERDHGALFSLEHVEAGIGEGRSRWLARAREAEEWGRSAVQDRAAPRREVVDESRGVGLRLGLGLLGRKRCQHSGGADSDLPVRLPICLGRVQGATQHFDRVAPGGNGVFPLANRDPDTDTSVGLSRLGLLDPYREGRRRAPDLRGTTS